MISDLEDQAGMSAQTQPGLVQEYWQAMRAFSPSLRRFLLAAALVTTAVFGTVAVLQNLFLLRLGFDARSSASCWGLARRRRSAPSWAWPSCCLS
jgi:hypothetical protein